MAGGPLPTAYTTRPFCMACILLQPLQADRGCQVASCQGLRPSTFGWLAGWELIAVHVDMERAVNVLVWEGGVGARVC